MANVRRMATPTNASFASSKITSLNKIVELFSVTNKSVLEQLRLVNTSSRSLNLNHRKNYFIKPQLMKLATNGKISMKSVIRIDKKNININPSNNQQLKANGSGETANNSAPTAGTVGTQQKSASIFKRFKEAYKQHGKILIWTHAITCCGWITGFFMLSKG